MSLTTGIRAKTACPGCLLVCYTTLAARASGSKSACFAAPVQATIHFLRSACSQRSVTYAIAAKSQRKALQNAQDSFNRQEFLAEKQTELKGLYDDVAQYKRYTQHRYFVGLNHVENTTSGSRFQGRWFDFSGSLSTPELSCASPFSVRINHSMV